MWLGWNVFGSLKEISLVSSLEGETGAARHGRGRGVCGGGEGRGGLVYIFFFAVSVSV